MQPNFRYRVNEVFYSLQGEGVRCGTPNVFVRFTGCNMRCALEPGKRSPGGFDCDTEFLSGRWVDIDGLTAWIDVELGDVATPHWIILTGGEPASQVDNHLITELHDRGYKLAIETNGSIALPAGIDWITVSPKIAEHAIRQRTAHEVKYVRGYGQGVPKTVVTADHYLISPAFRGNQLDQEVLQWCMKLCRDNPPWRLSVQNHKAWTER